MDALVILILVLRGEASNPTTLGAVKATHELLGRAVDVKIKELDSLPPDDQALEIGKGVAAFAIIELAWDSGEHRQARVHFHFESRAGWNDRVIGFNPSDDPAERGRTIGFAVASMLPGRSSPAEPTPSPEPPSSPQAPSQPTREGRPEPTETLPPLVRAGAASGRHWVGSVDVLGSAAMGVEGEAPGWGGSVSARWYVSYPLGVRFGASARFGELDRAQATSLLLHLAAGVVWLPVMAGPNQPFEVGARLDLLAMRERLTHYDSDDIAPIEEMRWLPEADAALEGSWLFNPTAGIVGAIAAETAFGQTDVTLHQERVATIPVLRLVLQAGVRASF